MLNDNDPITFGKYKGTPLGEVPADYLDWLLGQDFTKIKYPDLYSYLIDNADVIHQELDDDDHSEDQFSIY